MSAQQIIKKGSCIKSESVKFVYIVNTIYCRIIYFKSQIRLYAGNYAYVFLYEIWKHLT
jgi:hypothetical protein